MSLSDALIVQARGSLYSSVVSDVLDTLGNLEHAMLPHVRPLDESLTMFGRARTGLYMEVFAETENENPYDLEITLVDDLQPNEIAVLACPVSPRVAPWGELLSTAAKARGAVGCVTDGLVRDVRVIRKMGFPVFAGGIGPLDAKGRGTIMKIDVPVVCGGVRVSSGDWVFGDADGVVVIPDALAEPAVLLGLEKVAGEDVVRDELASGAFLRDVFDRHGIL